MRFNSQSTTQLWQFSPTTNVHLKEISETQAEAMQIAVTFLLDALPYATDHGFDRKTNGATRFRRRNSNKGMSPVRINELFHIEHFERIIKNWEAGKFQFLSENDIADIRTIIEELR